MQTSLARARLRRLVPVVRSARNAYGRHADSELAAAIAYRTLFSVVPFVAVLVALLDALLPTAAREEVVGWLLGGLPGTAVEDSVERELADSGALASFAGVFALGTLIWTASAMTRSVRIALSVVWESDARPAFVRARLRDIAALGVLAVLVLGVLALSLATQIAVQLGVSASDVLGLGRAASALTLGVELTVSTAATFAALLVVYRFAAPTRSRFAVLWPGTLVTAVAITFGVAGYAYYLVHLASFDTVYGPLGAVLAFLAVLYLAAALVLFGAELVVATTPRPEPAAAARARTTR